MNEYKELKGIRQVVFAFGHIGPGMLNQFITTWLLIFLSGGDNILLDAGLVGVCIMLGRLIDAVADPLVANWSDRLTGNKLGRRLPFMLIGTIPMIISFNMLWYTQLLDGTVLRFIWVVVAVNLFYFTYTAVVNPYFALMPEIAKDKSQRMFIQSFVAFFGILGMGIAMGASGFLIDAIGFAKSGLILSLFCAFTMVGPALTVRVNHTAKIPPSEEISPNVFIALRDTLANKTFRTYIFGFCIFFLGFQMIQYNLAFITTVLLGLSKGMSSTLFISSVVFGLLFIPVYNIILRKVSCSTALKLAVSAYVVVALLIACIPLLLKTGIDGKILGFILMGSLGFPYSGLMVIPNVIVSEIIDEDIRINNIHREALFFGVQGLINNGMISLAALVVGLLQSFFGNTIEHPWGVMAVAPLAAVVALIGMSFLRRLHITKED